MPDYLLTGLHEHHELLDSVRRDMVDCVGKRCTNDCGRYQAKAQDQRRETCRVVPPNAQVHFLLLIETSAVTMLARSIIGDVTPICKAQHSYERFHHGFLSQRWICSPLQRLLGFTYRECKRSFEFVPDLQRKMTKIGYRVLPKIRSCFSENVSMIVISYLMRIRYATCMCMDCLLQR